MSAAVPTVVIGGYLGAGKTTLVNHLLRHAEGRRIAVLVNDFGDVSIDAALIAASPGADGSDGQVMALAGGCICCSFGADLVGTLARIAARRPPPDVVLIETSGVALPAAVARTARLAPGIEVEGIVVLADAATLRRRAADRYVGDTVQQQLQAAQLVLLNKVDTVEADAAAALPAWLKTLAPRAVVLPCRQAEVPAEVVLGMRRADEPSGADGDETAGSDPAARWAAGRRAAEAGALQAADAVFVSHAWQVPTGTAPQAVADALAAQAGSVVRAKGLLQDSEGQTWLLQAVGEQVQLVHQPRPAAAALIGRVQIIGLRGLFHPGRGIGGPLS